MKIAIVGFGEEGMSTWAYLRKQPKYKKAEIWILDRDPQVKIPRGAKSALGPTYLSNLERFDLLFRTPGLPLHSQALERARRAGKKVSSVTKTFFDEARKRGVKIIGVTGSKGKSTTATLLYLILKAGGMRVFLAGNVGISPLGLLPKLRRGAWVVLELSSFQLQDLDVSPHIAAILDVFPEHLDMHKTVAEYYRAKGNICRYQTVQDKTFYLGHNPITRWLSETCPGERLEVTERDAAPFVREELRLPGVHTYRNALIAARIAAHLGVKPETIRRVVARFPGLPHRLELVRTLPAAPRRAAIEFYNDSAAHNPNAASAALACFPNRPKVLIAGGKNRPFDYTILRKALEKHGVKDVVLFGENKLRIKTAIEGGGIVPQSVATLAQAVRAAHAAARRLAGGGTATPVAVLFSPAAPSYDMFRNFEERGREFNRLVKSLPK